jgi:hypothetical protein
LRIEGEGQEIVSVTVDDKTTPSAFVSATITGKHPVTIRIGPAWF